jgi:hypothetical protein
MVGAPMVWNPCVFLRGNADENQSRSHVNTRNAWIFFGITVVEAIANCGLEAALFYFVASTMDIRADASARTIPTYLAIYILAL